jgi:CRP-like cAMP-binding protein/di/tricarboxylate transporter
MPGTVSRHPAAADPAASAHEAAAAIACMPLFGSLSRINLAKLVAQLEEVSFAPGEYVIRQGEPGDAYYIVRSGTAAVVAGAGDGSTAPLALCRDGDGFGEVALFTGLPRTASVIAWSPLQLWRLSSARFDALLQRERTIAQTIERGLALRVAALTPETAACPPAEELTEPTRAVGETAVRAPTPATARTGGGVEGSARHAPRRHFPVTHVISAGVACLLYTLGWLLPEPAGLSRGAVVTLGTVLASIPLLATAAAPQSVVSLLMLVALVVPHVVTLQQALAGFGTSAWLMIVLLGGVTTAVSRSGLLYRLALLSLLRLPRTFLPQSGVLSMVGILLTAAVTSGTARIGLAAPVARAMADAMRFEPRGRSSAALGLVTFLAFSQMETLFLTGATGNLLLYGLLPEPAQSQVGFGTWVLAALCAHALLFATVFAAALLLLRPFETHLVNPITIRTQQRILGPLSRTEVIGAAGVIGLIAGLATRPLHGIDAPWVVALVFLGLYVTGALDSSALNAGSSLSMLVSLGVSLGLRGIFTAHQIDVWLASTLKEVLPSATMGPYAFVGVLATLAWTLHFFVPWLTASPILALATMPLAAGLGISPLVPVLVVLVAGNHTFLPHLNSAHKIMDSASEGALFTRAQARPLLWIDALARVPALILSVPAWHALGLL